ncbi:unnamed protein product [Thelazia callipaeda]|uniref:ZP domain-containing protein n=1 Tax=Thelazia callipaeda TaxID=103827 RepID=A0A0N5CZJ9_THECL|nr:unnamed protein product [Thelazia callipaeda]
MIWRGRICIGDDKSGACCSQLNMIQEYGAVSNLFQYHIVSVGYSKCGIEKTFFTGGFNFIAKVYFSGVISLREQFEVQCAVPFVESHVKARMVASGRPIRISSVDFTSSTSVTEVKPVSVRLGSNLHIAIEPTLKEMQERLHTYPLNCWVTVASSSVESTVTPIVVARRYFIKNGCPSTDDNSLLAFLEQKTGIGRFAEWTKVTIPITRNLVITSLLNGSVPVDESVEYGRISLHCDIVFCTGQKLKGFQNTPMCPHASFCSPSSQEQQHLPYWIEPYIERAVTVSLPSPIRILLANASEPSLDSNDMLSLPEDIVTETNEDAYNAVYDSKCARVCAVAVEEALRKDSVECRFDGIPVYVVIIIAIISFGFGVAFVATLWLIHNKTDIFLTDPLRKIRCADQSGRGMPLNALYRDSVIRPYNNAFMIPCGTTMTEREQLVYDRPR